MSAPESQPQPDGQCAHSLHRMVRALEGIRDTAMKHPCFWREAFEARDTDALCKEGGDVCDWTFLAITADDALRPNDKVRHGPTD